MSKTYHRTLANEMDDRWRRKGVVHTGKDDAPQVCPVCKGTGKVPDLYVVETDCPNCEGTGEIYG
jgi:DnaJ-class molecular chaperone